MYETVFSVLQRISLTEIIHHRWVCGPLLLEHAQCIANCREEMELPYYDPVTLDLGSVKDDELVQIIGRSVRPGDPGSPLMLWNPPKVDPEPQTPERPNPSDLSYSDLHSNYRSCLTASTC